MYERILHPTDGTRPSRAATDHALELATEYGATLYVLYALQVGEEPPAFTDDETPASADSRGTRAVQDVVAAAASRDVATVEIFGRGSAADAILSAVDARDIDLVVMGTHGWSGLDRVVLGSVAESVVRRTPVPVLVAPPDAARGSATEE